jgi:orotate phosphoribosyltransferase
MSILSTGLEKLQHFALAPTAVRTTNLSGTAVDLNDYEGDVVVILDVASGGTSTLDVKIQSADTSGGSYGDVTTAFYRDGSEVASAAVAFAQVSTSASKQYLVFPKGAAKRFIKAVSTTSSSSHTYSINAVGAKKYV